MEESMRAVVFDRYGGPEELYEQRVPIPDRQTGDVLVRVETASVNGADVMLRSGKLSLLTSRRFPKRLGIDFVGTLVAADGAADLGGLAVGSRVWGAIDPRRGPRSLAEVVSVPATQIALAPNNLTAEEAVTLIAGGTTAHTALVDHARVRPGERVLVPGAAGGVGSVAVQLAKSLGATVSGLAGASSLEFVRSLGADEAIDYRQSQPAGLGTFDVIFDAHGGDLLAYRRMLAPRGRMVSIAIDGNSPARSLLAIAASGVFGSRRIRFFRGNPDRRDFERLTARVERGELRPVLDRVFPLMYTADAHKAMEARGVQGKLVIAIPG